MQKNMNNKKGFTLAEVLMVLVVVGVVASLVIPPLVNDTQDAEMRTAFKNNYAALSSATKRVVQDNGGSLVNAFVEQEASDHHLYCGDNFRDQVLQYMSYVRKCDDALTFGKQYENGEPYILSNCWSKDNYYLNKNLGKHSRAYNSQVILNNGAYLDFSIVNTMCTKDESRMGATSPALICGKILIDVNGFKAPNQYGKDIFWINVLRNGIAPEGSQWDWSYQSCAPSSSNVSWGSGIGCAGYVLKNQDY